jgi:hypothetical protein
MLGMTRKQFDKWAHNLPSVRQGANGWRYWYREDVEHFRDFVSATGSGTVPEAPKRKPHFWE